MKSLTEGNCFHHVAIRARDFDVSVRFYTQGLGLRVHFQGSVPGLVDRAAYLDTRDGRFVEIFGPGSLVQAEGPRRAPEEAVREGAVLHFCLRATDVDASYHRAIAAGGVSRLAPVARRLCEDPVTDMRVAFVVGPSGEVIELLQSDQL